MKTKLIYNKGSRTQLSSALLSHAPSYVNAFFSMYIKWLVGFLEAAQILRLQLTIVMWLAQGHWTRHYPGPLLQTLPTWDAGKEHHGHVLRSPQQGQNQNVAAIFLHWCSFHTTAPRQQRGQQFTQSFHLSFEDSIRKEVCNLRQKGWGWDSHPGHPVSLVLLDSSDVTFHKSPCRRLCNKAWWCLLGFLLVGREGEANHKVSFDFLIENYIYKVDLERYYANNLPLVENHECTWKNLTLRKAGKPLSTYNVIQWNKYENNAVASSAFHILPYSLSKYGLIPYSVPCPVLISSIRPSLSML